MEAVRGAARAFAKRYLPAAGKVDMMDGRTNNQAVAQCGRGVAAAMAIACLAAACASQPRVDAQWTDPQLGVASGLLRGARVLVACDAQDVAVRQLCQDRVAAEVVTRGATPVFVPADAALALDRGLDGQLVPVARSAGATAVLVVSVAPAVTDVAPGFSIGIGGFGFGGHGGSAGVGVGVGGPIGGAAVTVGFGANARLTDASTGRVVWAARALATPSTDVSGQLGQLAWLVLDAAGAAGLF
jgi:hypothetical protein